ncbi:MULTISPECIES: acyltransferase family protein [unclassified Coleofasciculus]|uniref:acyltransferase family protein n=1 Tax=unclassified Coleofasciculus TaxID=2692782 RepID=UPI001882D755|nr:MULTISPECIES: acyltransferase [unclassified Coleofasciculus]MBE9127554.1 acyltransferase [Coleofasciculus sp. LEGE 07081]MBE9147202.1 acyltransferase [Coleofasciculus sp. LEGE 07092]
MRYITQLDGIRAISVIFVLIGHWSTPPLKNAIPWGNIGVYTFFVISGYLITSILLELKAVMTPGSALSNFWGRRILRIFPIYYLTITILWLIQHQPVSDHAVWHFTFLSNFLMMSSVGYQGTTDHLWSLAVEGQFYLVWPLVIFLLNDKYLPPIILSLLILSPVCRFALYMLGMGSIIKVFPLSSVDFLGIGALVALGNSNRQFMGFNSKEFLKAVAPFAATGFVLIELLRHLGYHNILYSLVETSCLVLGLGWLISATSKGITGIFKTLLDLKGLRFIGRISYGLYLYHLFVSYYLVKAFPRLSLEEGIGNPWVSFMIFFIGSFLLATASWFIVEKPLMIFKKYFPLHNQKSSKQTT